MKRPATKTLDKNQDDSKTTTSQKKARISQALVPSKAPSQNSAALKSVLKKNQKNVQAQLPKVSSRPKLKLQNTPKLQSHPPNSITIVIGTYEHILYGFNISFAPSNSTPAVTTLFHFVAHPSPINVLAIPQFPANPTLATSATDSPLTLWSVSKRRCLGTLSCGMLAADSGGAAREPGVHAARYDRSGNILVVGDETGGMTVYRTSDWALVRQFTGSGKGRVNDLAIEPQKGRLMLSVGQDRCLRMWDLSGGKDKGKPMASVRLGAEAERLGWSPSGKKLVVITGMIVTVYDTMMTPLFTFTSPRGRVHDAKFFIDQRSQEYLFLACDDSVGRIFHLGLSTVNSDTEPQCVAELLGHSSRVKSIELVTLTQQGEEQTYAVTISSDGFCHLYKVSSAEWDNATSPIGIEPFTKYDTGGCRLTCLATVAVSSDKNLKSPPEQLEESDQVASSEADDDNDDEEAGMDLDANGERLVFDHLDDASSE